VTTDVLLIGAEELENLGTRYLAAVLREHGFRVELASFSAAAEQDAVLWHTCLVRPRVIGLSVIFQYRAPEFLELATRLRDLQPGAHITAGGHFPTLAADALLHDYPVLDSVVRGEGEFTLLELVERIDTPAEWGRIPGLSFRDRVKVANRVSSRPSAVGDRARRRAQGGSRADRGLRWSRERLP
jgi:anaerobic magnesium-protoporphyrin IX monomethyl ester cyclase